MISSISPRLRHFPLSPSGQYLPLPYAPSSEAASLVTSVRSFSSFGAGNVNDNFRSFILRATSGGSCRPSNRRDCSASSVVAAINSSFAPAERASVSSVMKVLLIQSARLNLTFRSKRRFSASSINFWASSGVPLALETAGEFGLLVHEVESARPRLTSKNAPVHRCPLRQIKFILPPLAERH